MVVVANRTHQLDELRSLLCRVLPAHPTSFQSPPSNLHVRSMQRLHADRVALDPLDLVGAARAGYPAPAANTADVKGPTI